MAPSVRPELSIRDDRTANGFELTVVLGRSGERFRGYSRSVPLTPVAERPVRFSRIGLSIVLLRVTVCRGLVQAAGTHGLGILLPR